MTIVAIAASTLVGAAFVVAGASKMAARDSWPAQARALGAPTPVIPVVPWVELVIGAVMIARVAPVWTAAAAGLLLVAFTAAIAVQLMRGRRPACACFGAWSATPIGPWHLARNAALLLLAGLSAL